MDENKSISLDGLSDYNLVRQKHRMIDNFRIIGDGRMDAIRLIVEMTPNTQRLINLILDMTDKRTSEVLLSTVGLSNTQKSQRSKSIREVIKIDVIKKLGRNQYIVNPYFAFPRREYQDSIIDRYNELG